MTAYCTSSLVLGVFLMIQVAHFGHAQLAGEWSLGSQRFSEREKHALYCFDNGTVVVFGGRASDGKQKDFWTGSLTDATTSTWEWDQSYIAGDITGREALSIAYLSTVDRYFLFGGRTDSIDGVADLWTISDNRWSFLGDSSSTSSTSSTWPLGRYRHQGVTLTGGDSFVVLFGTSVDRLFNDVWSFNATAASWTQLHSGSVAAGSSEVVPESRFDPCCVFRSTKNSIVCFGGTNITLDTRDVWEFFLDNNTWKHHEISSSTADNAIPSLRRLAMCSLVDAAESKLIVWSGYSSSDSDNSAGDVVYTFDLETDIWTGTTQTSSFPIARDGGQMCPGSTEKGLWLFGGLDDSAGAQKNDIWTLDNSTYVWSQSQDVVSLPAARSEHSAVVIGTSMIVLFGEASTGYLEDVWSYDTETAIWTQLSASCSFGARKGAAAVERGNSVLVMGGLTSSGPSNELLSFAIDQKTWRSITATNTPDGRYHHGALLIESTKLLIIGGITSSSSRVSDMYIFDPSTSSWSSALTQTPSTIPARRSFGLVRNPKTDEIVVLGGKSSSVLMDRWVVAVDSNTSSVVLTELASTVGDAGEDQRQYIRSEAAVIGAGRHYVVCGGAISGSFPAPEASICYQYDSVEGTNKRMTGSMAAPYATYFMSGVYVRNTIYFFGGNLITDAIKRTGTYLSVLQKYTFTSSCSNLDVADDATCMHCASGSSSSNCSFTDAGYYRPPNVSSATACPAGRQSTTRGAQTSLFCLPCAEGTYNSEEGQSSCSTCPSNTRCPVGTASPSAASDLTAASNYELQPSPFSSEGVPLLIIVYVIAAWIVLVCLVFLGAQHDSFRKNRVSSYYIPDESMKYLRHIYANHLPDETGQGQGRGLTGRELLEALTDTAQLFYAMKKDEVEDMVSEDVVDELMEYFDLTGTTYLKFEDFKLVICMLFAARRFPPLQDTPFKETGEVQEIKKAKSPYQQLDIFSTQHNFWKVGEPVNTRKTVAGGALTVSGGLAVTAIATLLIILFLLDNTEETQATLPAVAVSQSISTSVSFSVVTLGEDQIDYCIEPGTTNNTCVSGSSISVSSGLSIQSGEDPTPRCFFNSPGYCTMEWSCASCALSNSTETFGFLFGHPDWYSTETVVTVAAGSGVRENFGATSSGNVATSTVNRVFGPSVSGQVLKGYPATSLTLDAVPTTWRAPRSVLDVRVLEGTGYHVTTSASVTGNEAQVSELPAFVGVPVEITFNLSPTYLVMERFLKKDAISVLSTILGVFSGVLAVGAFVIGRWDWLTKHEDKTDFISEDEAALPLNESPGFASGKSLGEILRRNKDGEFKKPKRKRKFINNHADALVKECGFRRKQARQLVTTMALVSTQAVKMGKGNPDGSSSGVQTKNILPPALRGVTQAESVDIASPLVGIDAFAADLLQSADWDMTQTMMTRTQSVLRATTPQQRAESSSGRLAGKANPLNPNDVNFSAAGEEQESRPASVHNDPLSPNPIEGPKDRKLNILVDQT